MAGLPEDMRADAEEMIEHPRCAILPSPEKLDKSITSPGQDATNTRADFHNVCNWLKSSEFFNTGYYEDILENSPDPQPMLEEGRYNALIFFALINAFDPIRNTFHPDREEMVLLYYTGHGSVPQPGKSSSPDLARVSLVQDRIKEHSDYEREFLTENRGVKGGELCLHDVGYCDLQGLLTPWIVAVREKSINVTDESTKENKHLVVIADSCYSGMLVNDLEELAKRDGPWNQNGCTVTVQSASSCGEATFGGYFTPCFVHFNKPENYDSLQILKDEWKVKSETEKDAYLQHPYDTLPSPQVATTMPFSEDDPVMELEIQGSKLILFHDAGFFKFCFLSFSGKMGCEVRSLTSNKARQFLSQKNSTILDYKLKKMRSTGTPMALVLVNDRNDNDHVICAHIHFYGQNTNLRNVSGVNLIHHNRPTNVGVFGHIFLEDNSNMKCRFQPSASGIMPLVRRCMTYVESEEPGRWGDVSKWNMKKSYNQLFRLNDRRKWMESYVKKYSVK